MNAPAGKIPEIETDEIWRPGRLYSLEDIMQRFRASSFSAATSALARAATFIEASNADLAPNVEADRLIVKKELSEVETTFADLPLSVVLTTQFDRLKKSVDSAESGQLVVLVREMHENLLAELTSAWFLMIKADRRKFYEMADQPFGQNVAVAFSDANKDISAASRCFALDEWTACVLHLMRVLEHGLRAMARKVGLDAESMGHENWKNVIDQMEKKIREMEGERKSPEKIERIKSLSDAATQFRFFKDAWRNYASHGHAWYDEREAGRIFDNVNSFMGQMAEIVLEEQPS